MEVAGANALGLVGHRHDRRQALPCEQEATETGGQQGSGQAEVKDSAGGFELFAQIVKRGRDEYYIFVCAGFERQ